MDSIIVRCEIDEFIAGLRKFCYRNTTPLLDKLCHSFVLVLCDVDELAPIVQDSWQLIGILQLFNTVDDVLYSTMILDTIDAPTGQIYTIVFNIKQAS